jgi:hypothetical protein
MLVVSSSKDGDRLTIDLVKGGQELLMANYLRSHVSNKVSLAMFVMSILRS